MVNTKGTNDSKIGHLVEDIKIKLRDFAQWAIQGVRRMVNRAAHFVAWLAVRERLGIS